MIHTICQIFNKNDDEGVMLVNAFFTFNQLNHEYALQNFQVLGPSIATVLINTYQDNAQLFIVSETPILTKGTRQEEPLAMPSDEMANRPYHI